MPLSPQSPRWLAAGFTPILVAAWLAGATASAEPLQAVVTGGLISGDWAGTPFTNASYTVAATYDPALPQSTLLAQLVFGGDSVANAPATWQTSTGELNITASTDGAGTFAIVPEPAGTTVVGLALVALARRRRFGRA